MRPSDFVKYTLIKIPSVISTFNYFRLSFLGLIIHKLKKLNFIYEKLYIRFTRVRFIGRNEDFQQKTNALNILYLSCIFEYCHVLP